MFDQETRRGAEAAKRRDELLGKYRLFLKAALSAKTPAECEVAVRGARKSFESAKLEQEKLRNAQTAAIDELTRWKAGTDATWSQVQSVAEDQLANLEGLLESSSEPSE